MKVEYRNRELVTNTLGDLVTCNITGTGLNFVADLDEELETIEMAKEHIDRFLTKRIVYKFCYNHVKIQRNHRDTSMTTTVRRNLKSRKGN